MTDRDIFINAPENVSPEVLEAYIKHACRGDVGLERRVRALFEAAHEAPSFLNTSPVQEHVSSPSTDDGVGGVIGNYKILQEIGRGGFGAVYMADQLAPVRRRVALKIIKLGMDTKEVIARFEAERQALAMMDHPNIAKVLDAGTTETGRPYFVMELVRGIRITQFCREANLKVNERLALFLDVCRAVQHAHQKGIIHRDLKPSNVMVTLLDDKPVPKVIDFGVAKATQAQLTDKTMFTRFEMFIGTPAYMSPEQAQISGMDIDTRSDIYALGVLLYELLTGSTPFDSKALAEASQEEIRRVIREEEPPRLSTRVSSFGKQEMLDLASHLRCDPQHIPSTMKGDLDWIVMKAMDKDRSRRYATANALAFEIQRYLDGEPVLASPPSTAYRVGKFARKYRMPIVVGAAMLVLALVGVLGVVWQWRIAVANAGLAEMNARQSNLHAQRALENAQDTERALEQAQINGGKAWLERAHAYADQTGQDFYAALMAGRALGFQGYGRADQMADFLIDYPVLIQGEGELRQEAQDLIRQHARSPRPIWSSPATVHHRGYMRAVAYSPDGDFLASASDDSTVVIWDARRGERLVTLAGHLGPVTSIAFSSDSRILASGGDDNSVILWRRAANVWKQEVLKGHLGRVSGVAFTPDGNTLASVSDDGSVKLWEVEVGTLTDTLTETASSACLEGVAISPDGKRLACGSHDSQVKLWDLDTRQVRSLPGHTDRVVSVAFSPDGKTLASGSFDFTCKLWDVDREINTATITKSPGRDQSKIKTVAFSPDGETLACSHLRQVDLWDMASLGMGVEPQILRGHYDFVLGAAFSPDGRTLASGGWDRQVLQFDVSRGQRLLPQSGDHPGKIRKIAISADGRLLAGACEDWSVRIWNLQRGQLIHRLTGHQEGVHDVAFSPDGSMIASASMDDQEIILWDVETGTRLPTLPGSAPLTPESTDGGVSLAFGPNGHYLVAGGRQRHVTIWDVQGRRRLLALPVHENQKVISTIAFSPDGRFLATGSHDRTVHLWDFERLIGLEQGRQPDSEDVRRGWELKGHTQGISSIAFSPDGRWLASGGADHVVKLWDHRAISRGASAEAVRTLVGYPSSRWSFELALDFSPDSQTLVSASATGSVILWSPVDGKRLASFQCHDKPIQDVAFSPDGKTLFTCSEDQTVKLWDLSARAQVLAALRGEVASLDVTRDGTTMVSGSDDHTVMLWDVRSGTVRHTLKGHEGRIFSVVVSPDDTTIASASDDGTIRLWDLADGTLTKILQGHDRGVLCVAFGPDSFTLASSGKDGRILLWDTTNDTAPRTIADHEYWVHSVALSPDGSMLAGGKGTLALAVWDMDSGEELVALTGHQDSVRSVAFAPNGKTLVSGSYDNTVKLWDVETIRKRSAPVPVTLRGSGEGILKIAFNASGSRLAAGGLGKVITVWDMTQLAAGGHPFRIDGHASDVLSLAFIPGDEGHLVSAGRDHTVKRWMVDAEKTQLADYLSKGWLAVDGRNVSIPSEADGLHQSHPFGFMNVPPHTHVGMLHSGASEKERRERLFWSYLRAKNWESTLALFKTLTDSPVRDRAFQGLVQWLRLAEQSDAVIPEVVLARLNQLSEIADTAQSLPWQEAILSVRDSIEKEPPEPTAVASVAPNLTGRWINYWGGQELHIAHDGDALVVFAAHGNQIWTGEIKGDRIAITATGTSYLNGTVSENATRILWDTQEDHWRLLRRE